MMLITLQYITIWSPKHTQNTHPTAPPLAGFLGLLRQKMSGDLTQGEKDDKVSGV